MNACMHAHLCVYLRMHVCMYYVRMYVCVCMYMFMHVCTYVCMYAPFVGALATFRKATVSFAMSVCPSA